MKIRLKLELGTANWEIVVTLQKHDAFWLKTNIQFVGVVRPQPFEIGLAGHVCIPTTKNRFC